MLIYLGLKRSGNKTEKLQRIQERINVMSDFLDTETPPTVTTPTQTPTPPTTITSTPTPPTTTAPEPTPTPPTTALAPELTPTPPTAPARRRRKRKQPTRQQQRSQQLPQRSVTSRSGRVRKRPLFHDEI